MPTERPQPAAGAGSVAVTGPDARFATVRADVRAASRATASRASPYHRSGATR